MEHDNFIGIQKARGRKNAHHSLGMRFYSSHALSVELSAFAWSANESIIHHRVYACACVCWCALFVWSSGWTIDTTACWTECILLPAIHFASKIDFVFILYFLLWSRILNTQYKFPSNWLIGRVFFFCVAGYPFNGIFRVQNTRSILMRLRPAMATAL